MTLVSRIAKFSRIDGEKQVVFHLNCPQCQRQNRIQLAFDKTELARGTCGHFHDYNLAFLREGIVYFQFHT